MQKNANTQPSASLKFLGVIVGVLLTISCSSSSTTIRIKTDSSSDTINASESSEDEDDLNQRLLTVSSEPKLTKEEVLNDQVNRLFNHYIKAEELLTEDKLPEAETELIKALNLVESKEGWMMLIKVYEQSGNQAKADSCKRRLIEFARIQSKGNFPN